jgi:uncharacterized cupin superfamily protein
MLTSSSLAAILLTFLLSPVSSFVATNQPDFFAQTALKMSASTETKTGPEIEVVSQPDKEFLDKKGVFNWGTWGCDVSKFPWTYDQNESCYLLKGKVTVTPTDGRKPVTFGKGDFVTFPAGMSCTWDVSEAVHKNFMFF